MVWNVKVDAQAAKQLEKLDKANRDRIVKFLKQIETLENPRIKGESLTELRFRGLWRYRVGDYRLISIVAVENFSGQYGEQLANQIKADLVSEGYIKISATASENVLTGASDNRLGKHAAS